MEEITISSIKNLFPKRDIKSNKGTFGQSVIIGGSKNYIGAPEFSNMASNKVLVSLGKASMRSGCGTSVLAIPDTLSADLYGLTQFSSLFSLTSKDGQIVYKEEEIDSLMVRATAFAIGMGMGNGDAESIVKHILDKGSQNIVIDADGLYATKGIKNYMGRCILTPHIKEMERISGVDIETIKKDPAEVCRNYAKKVNAIVVLKGSPVSYISDGEKVYKNCTGNVRLAKGGSGDVLSGIICGLLAWGMNILDAAKAGCYILGRAAEISDINEYSSLPTDIIDLIPKVLDEVMA